MKVFRVACAEDQITAAAVDGSATKIVAAGSVLMVVRSGILAHTFPVAVATVPVTLNQDMKAVVPSPEVVSDFLAYYLRSEGHRIIRDCAKAGTTVASIEFTALKNYPVPVPLVHEQHRIVAAIETHFSRLDAAVASLTRARANVKRARASVLKAAVEGRLVPNEAALSRAEGREYEPASVLLERILAERRRRFEHLNCGGAENAENGLRGKGRYKVPITLNTEGLPELPDGWVWTTIGTVSPLQPGYAFKSAGFVCEGIPLVKGVNVRNGWLSTDQIDYWSPSDLNAYSQYRLSTGDIVLAMDRPVYSSGSKAAKVAMIGGRWDGSLLLQRVGCFRRTSAVISHYLFAFLRGPTFRVHIIGSQNGSQDGKDLPHVSGGVVDVCPFPLPPLAEQHRIVAEVDRRLSVLDALDTTINANLARCARLRQSILKRAFEGRLVSSDVGDHPAHPVSNPPLLALQPGDTQG